MTCPVHALLGACRAHSMTRSAHAVQSACRAHSMTRSVHALQSACRARCMLNKRMPHSVCVCAVWALRVSVCVCVHSLGTMLVDTSACLRIRNCSVPNGHRPTCLSPRCSLA
eukprot:250502-Chlamydomonas_euryale.AAC.1